jgi:3',5'-cyclic AMP phosphodiesterase CpdA
MRLKATLFLVVVLQATAAQIKLPLKPKSVRFAVIGDSGTGAKPQYEVGQQLAEVHADFPFDFVIMLGDNLYGGEKPSDFKRKFEDPYKALLDAGVKFYASLGNHDDPNERFYKLFNMDGKRYYTFKRGEAQFWALDSNYMDPGQLEWLDKELTASSAAWKICFFHHPLYSHGKMHGSDVDLRGQLEPIFERLGVSAVFSGHDHIYERLKPQNGIYYFVLGSSGELRPGGLNPSTETAKGFATDRTFELVELSGDEMYFQTISRTGETVDSGVLERRPSVGAHNALNLMRRGPAETEALNFWLTWRPSVRPRRRASTWV